MIEEDFPTLEEERKGQFMASWAQLAEFKAEFIVPADKYNVRNDRRLLIPYIQSHHIGFVNQEAVPLVEPEYDIFNGSVLNESDLITVGKRYTYGFPRSNGDVQTYDKYKWGVIDSKGTLIIKCDYYSISISDDNQLITLRNYDHQYRVIDRNGNEIVPYGIYHLIDGFTNGYARIKDDKWGIIDDRGHVALLPEYDEIWNFYGWDNLNTCRVIKNGIERKFIFATGKLEP